MNYGKAGDFGFDTWNVDSLTGRAGELIETLADREMDVACIQEMQWFFGAKSKSPSSPLIDDI